MNSFDSMLPHAHWMTALMGHHMLFMKHLYTFIRSSTYENCAMIIANRDLFSIGGGGSSGKSKSGEEVADGEVLVEGEETRGEGGTGT